MISKGHEFFSDIYGSAQDIHSNSWKKAEYQIHSFIQQNTDENPQEK